MVHGSIRETPFYANFAGVAMGILAYAGICRRHIAPERRAVLCGRIAHFRGRERHGNRQIARFARGLRRIGATGQVGIGHGDQASAAGAE